MMIFSCMNHQKRNLTRLSKTLEFPQFPHGVAQHSRASNAKGKLKKVLNVYKENISAVYVSQIEIEEPFPIYNRYQEWSWGAWQTACCYDGEISHRFKYKKKKKNANIDFASWFLITKVLFWILWNFRVLNSICKRTEAKKGNTCTICPERN